MDRNLYMTTGEFAALMGVSKYTLFHYDDIGLFSPEYVAENGYRMYSLYQLETLETILMLRDLGMPLKEIRQRRKKISMVMQQDFSDIGIHHFPERYYLIRQIDGTSEKDYMEKTNRLILDFKHAEQRNDYEVAYLQYGKNLSRQIYNAYDNVLLLLEQKPKHMEYRIMPEGDYLTGFHVGHWNAIGEAYARMEAYRKEHKIQTDMVYLERDMVDQLAVTSVEEYVTEIAVRIVHENWID